MPVEDGRSVLRIAGGEGGACLVLYAGEPQNAPIVRHGPFVGGTRADVAPAASDYRAGRFARMSAPVRAASADDVVPGIPRAE